jgi:uncharacterized membrane protein HdeD (DUF308 family)
MKNELKSPKGLRILQIVLGVIAIALSLAIILNPGLGVATLIFLLSITLLVVGIERVAIGLSSHIPRSSRLSNIGLGALVIALGIVVIAFPLIATGILVGLVAFGLLFVGIARIIHGITAKSISKWSRIFLLGVGILSLAVSFMIFASPLLGIFLLTFILAINLLIIGIESIAYGITSHRNVATVDPGR